MKEGAPVIDNRKARHDYHVEEVYEAGIALTGTEVKSVRHGRVNLRDAYAKIENGEVHLYNCHIAPYEKGSFHNHDPYRVRKLLLHRHEIDRLSGRVRERGYTLIPLRMYFSRSGYAKIELGLCRGKRQYDKREDLRRREVQREVERALAERASRAGRSPRRGE